jgi:hypothetical protein
LQCEALDFTLISQSMHACELFFLSCTGTGSVQYTTAAFPEEVQKLFLLARIRRNRRVVAHIEYLFTLQSKDTKEMMIKSKPNACNLIFPLPLSKLDSKLPATLLEISDQRKKQDCTKWSSGLCE